MYFADNLDALAALAAKGGAKRIARIVDLLSSAQGWPLDIIISRQEINGTKLTAEDIELLKELVRDGILKPPSVERPNKSPVHFVFTPKPGGLRLDGASREIYERAMALVAAVRKGQLLPEKYRILYPDAILRKLRDSKRIGANSEAPHQYRNLAALKVGRLEKSGSRHVFHLIDTPENLQAVGQALALVRGESTSHTGIQNEAVIALSQDEMYIQSLISSQKLRVIGKPKLTASERSEFEQLLMEF